MTDRQTTDDIASTVSARVSTLGMKPHLADQLVDEFGPRYVEAAFEKVQRDMAAGHEFASPVAILISMLRSGEIQAVVARQDAQAAEIDESIETQRKRIHQVLSDPTMDCPQKAIARRPLPAEFAHLKGEPCRSCEGERQVLITSQPRYVTRDMAIDAGDLSMEGSLMPGTGEDYYEPCPDCGGEPMVKCPCGCHQEFPSALHGGTTSVSG